MVILIIQKLIILIWIEMNISYCGIYRMLHYVSLKSQFLYSRNTKNNLGKFKKNFFKYINLILLPNTFKWFLSMGIWNILYVENMTEIAHYLLTVLSFYFSNKNCNDRYKNIWINSAIKKSPSFLGFPLKKRVVRTYTAKSMDGTLTKSCLIPFHSPSLIFPWV